MRYGSEEPVASYAKGFSVGHPGFGCILIYLSLQGHLPVLIAYSSGSSSATKPCAYTWLVSGGSQVAKFFRHSESVRCSYPLGAPSPK